MSSTMVVGYLPTELGKAAVEQAASIAAERRSQLVVVNATRDDAPYDPVLATDDDIGKIAKFLEDQGIDHIVEGPIRGEVPADAILDAAERYDAQLIVIGLRNRSRVGKAIFGSTAQRVLLGASCSVLAAKVSDNP